MSTHKTPAQINTRILDYYAAVSREHFRHAEAIRQEINGAYAAVLSELDGYKNYTLANGDQWEAGELIQKLMQEVGRLSNKITPEVGDFVEAQAGVTTSVGRLVEIHEEYGYAMVDFGPFQHAGKLHGKHPVNVRGLKYVPEMFA